MAKIKFSISLSEDKKTILDKLSKETDRSLSWIINKAIDEYIMRGNK